MDTPQSSRHSGALLPDSLISRLTILCVSAFSMLFAASALYALISKSALSPRDSFLIAACAQNIFVFILPALLVAWLTSNSPNKYLEISTAPLLRQLVGMLIIYILITPAMNVIIDWNQNASFPDSLSSFESILRSMEEAAAKTTNEVLSDSSIWGLASGLLVVGCLTGFAEEMFFRAGLQRALVSAGINGNTAVWTVAFIFSVLHFQFFGFVPRMLLGAFFGYLYLYGKSIWLSSVAHALNNSVVVVSYWVNARFGADFNPESFGIANSSTSYLFYLSIILTAAFIYFFGNKTISLDPSSAKRKINLFHNGKTK